MARRRRFARLRRVPPDHLPRPAQGVMEAVGGPARAKVIGLLAATLALSSADTSAVGAAAAPLERALHVDNLQIGLLVALPALASAAATVPIGALSDRVPRVPLLMWSVVLWSLTMILGGAASSFEMLLLSRLVLGAAIATTGPTLASLTGDFFPSHERAKIYGFILTGDLVGSVVGLEVSGNVAAITWRLAFWVLVLPSAALAAAIWKLLPEPARGGSGALAAKTEPPAGGAAAQQRAAGGGSAPELERAVTKAGVQPRPGNVLDGDSVRITLSQALSYVLSVPTNVLLIIASSLNYFFIGGMLTFGVLFIRHQYSVGQAAATSLLGLIAIAAVVGVLVSGRLADMLVRGGRLAGRVTVTAACVLAACVLFLPPIFSHSLLFSLPLLWLAGASLYGSNPPLDASRLDVMPHWLWGRAEAVRTVLRSLTTAAAPVLFGFVSDQLGSGARSSVSGQSANSSGLDPTFLIMLVPLLAGGIILLYARRDYPRDVATAIASESRQQRSVRT